jgi:integrase
MKENAARFDSFTQQDFARIVEHASALPYAERRHYLAEYGDLLGDTDITKPEWLVDGSNFYSPIWRVRFKGKERSKYKTIDFNVSLFDGSQLTDEKNLDLMTVIKFFICCQLHPRFNGGSKFGPHYAAKVLTRALNIIDHLLLNGEVFDLVDSGLSLVSENDLKHYLLKHIVSPVALAVYDYHNRLTRWLLTQADKYSVQEMEQAEYQWPWVAEMPDLDDRVLNLCDYDLYRVRCAIMIRGDFIRVCGEYRFNCKSFVLTEYANTLHGKWITPGTPAELISGSAMRQEYPRVPVSGGDGLPNLFDRIGRHLTVLKKFIAVDHYYMRVGFDANCIADFDIANLLQDEVDHLDGRFLSLPVEVPFIAVRSAIENLFERSEVILNKMSEMLSFNYEASRSSLRIIHQLNANFGLIVSARLKQAGVKCWSIFVNSDERPEEYYVRLRRFAGLFEAYETIVGLLLVLIGVLTARRQGELLGLIAGKCIEPNKDPFDPVNANKLYSLRFFAGKTGSLKSRQKISVPITTVVAKALWRLQEFNDRCVENRLINPNGPLILFVARTSCEIGELSAKAYNHFLDVACDFCETPTITLDSAGPRRFYIRQHQLRRFLAMAFFWSSGFDGLDTLRYFLGHTDAKHIYRYISEALPGEVLRTVKVDKLVDSIVNDKADVENIESVKAYLVERFMCTDILAVADHEVEGEYGHLLSKNLAKLSEEMGHLSFQRRVHTEVAALMRAKELSLEPEFVKYSTGRGSSALHLIVKMEF